MEMKTITPVFVVDDVQKTAEWYRNTLGVEFGLFPEKPPYKFGIMRKDGMEIMLQQLEGYRKTPTYALRDGGTWDAYITLTGTINGKSAVEALFEDISDRVRVVKPLEPQFHGMTEFEMEDCNGYILVFAQASDSVQTECT